MTARAPRTAEQKAKHASTERARRAEIKKRLALDAQRKRESYARRKAQQGVAPIKSPSMHRAMPTNPRQVSATPLVRHASPAFDVPNTAPPRLADAVMTPS